MTASVLLAIALAQPVLVQSASARLGVTLRVVDPCDPAVVMTTPECDQPAYDRWLESHSIIKRVTEDGERILQIEF